MGPESKSGRAENGREWGLDDQGDNRTVDPFPIVVKTTLSLELLI